MFVKERQDLILQELNDKGKVRVKELSERFSVTEDLIRKDLSALEKEGKLEKIYGGAIPKKENVHRMISSQRKNISLEEKEIIVHKAYSLLSKGQVVFLDTSTTSVLLAKIIVSKNLPITVITNMLEVVNVLVHSEVNVIFVGGEFDYGRDGFVGALANEMLSKFRFDLAFLGVVGLDVYSNSVMTYMANDGLTKRVVLKNSKKAYMMCEHDKFNQLGNYTYASVDEFTGIITDQKLPNAIQEELDKLCVDIL